MTTLALLLVHLSTMADENTWKLGMSLGTHARITAINQCMRRKLRQMPKNSCKNLLACSSDLTVIKVRINCVYMATARECTECS